MKGKQHVFRVKFKERSVGRDGGCGPVKSFKATARDNNGAVRKLRKKNVRILSVRRIR